MAGMIVEQIAVLSDNYIYVVHDPRSGATATVDPALAEPVLDLLDRRGWRLDLVLNTHHHGDHTGGNRDLRQATGARVVGARRDGGRIPGLDQGVGDGEVFLLGDAPVRVMEVPGHTSGHIAFWLAGEDKLFCGDTLFSLGCGRLFEGTAAQMWASLCALRELPGETQVYCAHEYTAANGRFARTVEPDNLALQDRLAEVERLRGIGRPTVPTTIALERATNPFLRADEDGLARALGLAAGSDPAEVFAELRRRKDVF